MSGRRDLNCDVVVIGAGAAGLAAAADLSRAGLLVTVLESRDRIGGRVHTLHDPGSPHPIELGAEFVHGRPEEIFQILRRANLLACDADGEHWYLQGKRLRQLPHAWEDIGAVLERLGKEFSKGKQKDESYGRFIARNAGRFRRAQREMATLFVEGFNAAPADRVSARWLADAQRAEELGGAEEQFRLPGGYDRIVRHLAARCDVERCKLIVFGRESVVMKLKGSNVSRPLEH